LLQTGLILIFCRELTLKRDRKWAEKWHEKTLIDKDLTQRLKDHKAHNGLWGFFLFLCALGAFVGFV
jgi:hypothetical protein